MCILTRIKNSDKPYKPAKESRWKVVTHSLTSPFYPYQWGTGWMKANRPKFSNENDGFHCQIKRDDCLPLLKHRNYTDVIKAVVIELAVKGFIASGENWNVGAGMNGKKCETWKQAKIRWVWVRTSSRLWKRYSINAYTKKYIYNERLSTKNHES